jgi:iron transport multicopper oxidase
MAISLSNFLYPLPPLLLLARGALAATVTHNFNISWVAPPSQGAEYGRYVMGINGQWPIPPLYVTKGDNVIINAYNGLGNETTSLHTHGIFMNGTTDMDGAAQVSQCAIPPGSTFTYNYTVRFSLFSHSQTNSSVGEPARNILVSFSR